MTELKGKKVAVLGLGEENVTLVKFLANEGAAVTVCDQKIREELTSYLERLKNIDFELITGDSYLDNLQNFDLIFRTPGLPYLNSKIQEAKMAGAKISSQIKLFFELCPSPIIGVTGTKGKGTTTSLIGEILKASGKSVYVGGNIGNAPVGFLNELKPSDIVVLELSSFQLQDLMKSPHIAVVLDIKIDHLDYHSGREEYVQAKRNIVDFQTESDYAVINADYLTSFEFGAATDGKVFYFSRRKSVDLGAFVLSDNIILRTDDFEKVIIKTSEVKLRGEHNLENICAAVTASYLAGASVENIQKAVLEFNGLEHRLELVGEIGNVKYYNDSFSTTPDTTIAAIKSFSEPIILLLGGSEKNADYAELAEVISKSSIRTIIPIGLTAEKVTRQISNSNIKIIDRILTMAEAVALAKKEANSSDVVILSPASASFDRYKNYKDRGDQFKESVKNVT